MKSSKRSKNRERDCLQHRMEPLKHISNSLITYSKRVKILIGHPLANESLSLSVSPDVASLCLFYGYYYNKCSPVSPPEILRAIIRRRAITITHERSLAEYLYLQFLHSSFIESASFFLLSNRVLGALLDASE